MNRRSTLLLALLFVPALALAQWQWVDGSGRRVFSDQPPPPDVPAAKILKQPGGGGRVAAPAATPAEPSAAPAAAAAPATAPAARPGGTDPALEAKRRAAEAAEAAKRKAEEARIAKLRAQNCAEARQGKATLDSGVRLTQRNAQGEMEILDDAGRAARAQRLDEVIASECK